MFRWRTEECNVRQLFELSGGGGGGGGGEGGGQYLYSFANLHPCDLPRRARACVCVSVCRVSVTPFPSS